MRAAAVLLVVSLAAPARAGQPPTPSGSVRTAAAHARALASGPHYARYLSLHAVPPAARADTLAVVSFALNSLSREPILAVPPVVDGLVVFVDLQAYGIDPAAWDKLGVTGSGSAPFPDPYFHLVSAGDTYRDVEYGWWVDGDGRYWDARAPGRTWKLDHVERKKVADSGAKTLRADPLAPWLPPDAAADLAARTHSQAPIIEARWFVVNALIEPRYHELIGDPKNLADYQKLAFVDAVLADKAGGQRRGAVLFSEPAHRARALRRTPTAVRAGRGTFQESLDFKASVRGDDVLSDFLVDTPDARELIFTLKNGLSGYGIVDKAGKRIDFADPEVAIHGSTKLHDKLIWTARNCMFCHDAAKGWIPIDDEVRALARPELTLQVDRLKKTDPARAVRIRDQYLADDINEYIASDQASYETAAAAATRLAAPARANRLEALTFSYVDAPVTLAELELDTGVPAGVIKAAVESASVTALALADPAARAAAAPNHVLVGVAAGRKQRRDQVEFALPQLLTILSAQTPRVQP